MRVPYINMTPMIDILLVLLIIFMVDQPSKATSLRSENSRETAGEFAGAAAGSSGAADHGSYE